MKSIKSFENKKVNLAESNIAAGRKRTKLAGGDWLHPDNHLSTRDGFLGLGNDDMFPYKKL